ncbi:helix-turn-helix domain-containing protein [Streptomyces sp. NPDC059718]
MDVDTRRAEVRRLSRDEGLSLRQIAERLNVSKDTVRRDLGVARQPAATTATHATPARATVAVDETPRATPGEWLALDDETTQHLAVLHAAGHTTADAVALAVRLLANAYRHAWDYDAVPDGTAPHILGVSYAGADDAPAPDRARQSIKEQPCA